MPTTTLDIFLDDFAAHTQKSIPDVAVLQSPDYDALALLLAKVRECKRLLGMAEMFVEDELVKVMPGKNHEVPGLGVIELHTGATRKAWRKVELIDAMVHALGNLFGNYVDADTGEAINHLDLARRLIDAFTDAATPSWKVTGLRKYGIDPDEYCETSWGRKTVQTPTLPESTAQTS